MSIQLPSDKWDEVPVHTQVRLKIILNSLIYYISQFVYLLLPINEQGSPTHDRHVKRSTNLGKLTGQLKLGCVCLGIIIIPLYSTGYHWVLVKIQKWTQNLIWLGWKWLYVRKTYFVFSPFSFFE